MINVFPMNALPFVIGIAFAFGQLPSLASAQSFSCRIGTRAACLDYGDTVCSSLGKCVDSSSVCFDQYQCNYEGFTCKSNVSDCIKEYDDLLSRHNTLIDDYNELFRQQKHLVDEYEASLEEYQNLSETFLETKQRLQELTACVEMASSTSEAEQCLW